MKKKNGRTAKAAPTRAKDGSRKEAKSSAKSSIVVKEEAPEVNSGEAEALQSRGNRRSRIAIATLAIALLGVLPAYASTWMQLNQMSQQLESAQRQIIDSKRTERVAAPRVTPSYILAGWDFGGGPLRLARAVAPTSRVVSPDFATVDPFQDESPLNPFDSTDEYIRKGCHCGDLPASVNKIRYGDHIFWAYLVLSQTGGSTAQEVTVYSNEIPAGKLTFFNMQDSLDSIRLLKGREVQTPVGAIKSGESVIVPIWLQVDSYSRISEDDYWTTAISNAFVPLYLTYFDVSANRTERVDIRSMRAEPVILESGVAGRG